MHGVLGRVLLNSAIVLTSQIVSDIRHTDKLSDNYTPRLTDGPLSALNHAPLTRITW